MGYAIPVMGMDFVHHFIQDILVSFAMVLGL